LKFLEIPYRLWHKIAKGYRIAFLSIIWTAIIPYVIYQGIKKVLKFEYKVNKNNIKAKLRATLGEEDEKILALLDKMKIK
jgi:hypothetical protein